MATSTLNNIDEILNKAYSIGMLQDSYEIRSLLTFLQQQDVSSFIEIGTNLGGTFYALSSICSSDGYKISVDLCDAMYGQPYDIEYRNGLLSELCKNSYFIDGDSHHQSTLNRVSDILGDVKVDFIFIDGDHTYNGVALDYYMYRSFVKPNGWIVFHDIKQSDFHASVNVGVGEFWESLNAPKIWFIGTEYDGCGIGLVHNIL
jgi:predicted O-methyltransferase YrrM